MSGLPRAHAYRFGEIPPEVVREGFTRIAVRGDESIVTVNWFEPGYQSAGQHSHACDQLSFVLTGAMRFLVGDETFDLEAPAVLHIPGSVPHGAEPLGQERVLNLDVFAPVREDFRYLTDYQGRSGAVAD
jgi:mannose-6-phosphate isomerase-like protein (cupin superfamily)